MEEPASESRVPQHLQPFLRPSFTTEPILTRESCSNTPPTQTSPSRSDELCPPHWRLPPKRSLRSSLKAILLKDWQSLSIYTLDQRTSPKRPVIMRMKDSDDYITARAANPRTGLISPSIGSPTPCLPGTPDSPGQALQLVADAEPQSPTPEAKARPTLRRANEGRQVSTEHAPKWRPDGSGWLTDLAGSKASPRVTNANINAGLAHSKPQPVMQEDQFVVHMPSAREPQPWAYPGYSAKQIAAFEHYQHKARRVSGEGYDQRLLNAARQASSSGQASVGGSLSMSTGDSPQLPAQDITVVKKRVGGFGLDGVADDEHCHRGAQLRAANFAPFSSPRTPAMRQGDQNASVLYTLHGVTDHKNSSALHVHRKPVASSGGPRSTPVHCQKIHSSRDRFKEGTPSHISTTHGKLLNSDLRHLPSLKLVHPALAGLPHPHPSQQPLGRDGTRKCSLGCQKDSDRDMCIERLSPSVGTAASRNRVLFDNDIAAPSTTFLATHGTVEPHLVCNGGLKDHHQTTQLSEIFVTAIIGVLHACRQIHLPPLPRIGIFDVLSATDTSPQQKIEALRTTMSSTGHALIILTVIAILWQVGSAVMRAFEMLLWPLLVPFKILRWLVGGG